MKLKVYGFRYEFNEIDVNGNLSPIHHGRDEYYKRYEVDPLLRELELLRLKEKESQMTLISDTDRDKTIQKQGEELERLRAINFKQRLEELELLREVESRLHSYDLAAFNAYWVSEELLNEEKDKLKLRKNLKYAQLKEALAAVAKFREENK